LAQRQYALLTSALICLKPGGRIVYSTCALSPLENDQVIEKLLKKKEGFRIIPAEDWQSLSQGSPWQLPNLQMTKFGAMIYPDENGHGPIYLSVLEK
jgi:16S rRNA C967 or C1407 C5-methylase (RsmB/RsmF family)